MLSALAHSLTSQLNAQLPKPLDKTDASPYTPPTDLTPGIINRRTHLLFAEGDIKISRIVDWDPSNPAKPKILNNYLQVETGDRADHLHVRSWPGDKLQILINGKPHVIDIKEERDRNQELWIDTTGGDDTVIIDDDVKLRVTVEGGEGHDFIQAGGGRSRLYGGLGNDTLRLGSGLGYAEGNDGNDTLIGGSGNTVIYGNKGSDLLLAGFGPTHKQSYLDGGDDGDVLVSGSGHTVAHGGNQNDVLIGNHFGRTTFYTGKGNNEIWNNHRHDRIYASANDRFDRTTGSAFTEVKPSNVGEQGFTVKGATGASEEQQQAFRQRVADDFEFLRSSPIGQQALTKMDELAVTNGGKVTVRQEGNANTSYLFDASEEHEESYVEEASSTADDVPEDTGVPESYFIENGVAGDARADLATITYDPAAIWERADGKHTWVPVTQLFHEIGHAYNGATGTFLSGVTTEHLHPGKELQVNNFERQVVGLPNDADPFDFDNDPSTAPGTINPKPFTENALSEEMGKPLRRFVTLETSEQGDGT
jgi:Ca2+-binding RTX toxin-like protein